VWFIIHLVLYLEVLLDNVHPCLLHVHQKELRRK